MLPVRVLLGAPVGGANLGFPVPEARGTTVAGGQVALVEDGWGAGERDKSVDRGALRVLVGARPPVLASEWAIGEYSFLEEPVAEGRGRASGSGDRGVIWMELTVGRGALGGTGREVGGTGFWVGRADFVKEGAAVFWVCWRVFIGATEEGTEGLVRGRFG